MKGIKLLQSVTVAMFAFICLSGIAVFWFVPAKLADFRSLVSLLWPMFLAEVVPAFLGTPLTDAVRGLVKKPEPAQLDKDNAK